MGFQVRQMPQADLEFLVHVARHHDHFLGNFLLVVKLRKHFLELDAHFLQFARQLFFAALLLGLLPLKIFFIHLLVGQHELS